MTSIQVKPLSNTQFQVIVNSRSRTQHLVSVPTEYAQQLTGGRVSAEVLVEKSFEFLLAREPNTSILTSFELSVIARYFPDFESVIKRML